MSYILDALKKSETERQRQGSPGVADLPRAGARRQPPRWLWVVAGLLGANVVVLSAVLLREPATPSIAAPITAVTAPATVPEPAVAAAAAETLPGDGNARRVPAPADAPPAAVQAPAATLQNTTSAPAVSDAARFAETTSAKPADTAPAAAPTRAPATEQPTEPAPAAAVPFIPPTFTELRANGRLSLPDLHLDIHVWSPVPAERFVFVNMSKYREREQLAEGPFVREISQEGVVLEQRGTVFLLPRE